MCLCAMKRVFAICLLACFAQLSVYSSECQYTKVDSLKVLELLTEARRINVNNDLMVYFARKLCGIPYVGGTLDGNKEERLVVNLRQLDCTTYVENVLALTLCHANGKTTFADFCHYLRNIRYIDGIVSYVNRLHYFSEWIVSNTQKGYVNETQSPQTIFNKVQTLSINYMSTHPQGYPMLVAHPSWVKGIAAIESKLTGNKYRYIPKSAITNTQLLRDAIHDGDIIAITTNKKGLDVSHIGMAVWHKDGLHLLNASSIHHNVVEENMTLRAYMRRHPSQTGIRVIRVHGV